MGTRGAGLFEDDIAVEIREAFQAEIDDGLSPMKAAGRVLEEWAEAADDEDDGPVIHLALASLLLDLGVRQHPVLEEARAILEQEAGLERWQEAGETSLAGRREVYQQLLARMIPP
jgi:hypothetical protein